MATLATHLQSILWVHEEVASDVVKHDSVLPIVEISVLPPYHSEGLHLDVQVSINVNIFDNKGKIYHSSLALCSSSPPQPISTVSICLHIKSQGKIHNLKFAK